MTNSRESSSDARTSRTQIRIRHMYMLVFLGRSTSTINGTHAKNLRPFPHFTLSLLSSFALLIRGIIVLLVETSSQSITKGDIRVTF